MVTENSIQKSLINTFIYIGLLIIFNFVLPYIITYLLAGILEVPTELIENAKLDKISNLKIFLYIVIPMTSSTGLYVMVITILFFLY